MKKEKERKEKEYLALQTTVINWKINSVCRI